MQKEFEAQVLDIDKEKIIKKLHELGAKEEPEVFQRRWVYDIDPNDCHEWIRLRTNGKKTTICHKIKENTGINGTSETEIEVDDFEKANQILVALNFYTGKFY